MTQSNWNSSTPPYQMLQNFVTTWSAQNVNQQFIPQSSSCQQIPTIVLNNQPGPSGQPAVSFPAANIYGYNYSPLTPNWMTLRAGYNTSNPIVHPPSVTNLSYSTNQQNIAFPTNYINRSQPIKVDNNLETVVPKIEFLNCDEIKTETNLDWSEFDVKEEPDVKIEDGVELKEWIDWTELNVKEEAERTTTSNSTSNDNNCILISDESDTETITEPNNKETTNEKSDETVKETSTDQTEQQKSNEKETENAKNTKTLFKGAPAKTDVNINQDQIEEFKCGYCSYTTQWRNCYNRHVANKHEFIALDSDEEEKTSTPEKIGDWKFKCEHCAYKTNWKGNMRKHVISRHKADEEIEWFECAHCPYKGKTKEYLRFHLLTHDEFVKWLECEHCSFRAKQKYVLKRHVIINHAAEDEIEWFQCKHCPYRGKLPEHLRNHLQIHHTKGDIKKFKCEECSFKTAFKKNLRLHIISRHTREDHIQWSSCEKCSRKFKASKLLKAHYKSCLGSGEVNKWKKGTKEIPVVMGNKICFKRVPLETSLRERTVDVKDKRLPVKEMLCKCKNCIQP